MTSKSSRAGGERERQRHTQRRKEGAEAEGEKKEKMGSGSQLLGLRRRLVSLFLVFAVGFVASAAAARAGGGLEKVTRHGISDMRGPGFLYTRPRGRCTAQFWSSRREAWPRMVPQTASVAKIFGSRALERYRADLTVLEATERNDDTTNAYAFLLKQSSAALLNSYSRKDFPYTPWQVKTLLIQSLVSVEAAAQQARRFSLSNQACT